MLSQTIRDELTRSFDLATLRREAKAIRTPRQWQEAARLQRRCRSARVREKELYATRYQARVETARRRLVDEAGSIQRAPKPGGAGEDRFAPDVTLRQAEREVRERHHGRIARIEEFERRELRAIVDNSISRNNLQGQAQDALARVADRPNGQDQRRSRQRDRD
jgi:hypothetical protein